ncbi:MAG: cell division protein SepF, partial [Clostridia bacterium]|nr:cell division protein SepF [Clostridia bacterium]
MDRRDYNNEERDVFNNDGGRGDGFIPRRRFNFSRSDYQNPENLGANNGAQSGYQPQYAQQQPYSQANYQPNYQPNPPYQGQTVPPQYPNQQYAPQQPYAQPYAPQQPMGQPNMGQVPPMGQGFQYQEAGIDFDGRNATYEPAKKKGLFSFRKKQPQYTSGDMQNILIVTPRTLSEVQDIIDNLRNRQAIIVEFNRINEKSAQRILDFLNGAIYALGGCEQRIADNMFLFTPGGVSIQGQLK